MQVYDRSKRAARRVWKLRRLVVDGNIVGNETTSVLDEFERYGRSGQLERSMIVDSE